MFCFALFCFPFFFNSSAPRAFGDEIDLHWRTAPEEPFAALNAKIIGAQLIEFDRYFAAYNTTIDCSYNEWNFTLLYVDCWDYDFPQFFKYLLDHIFSYRLLFYNAKSISY